MSELKNNMRGRNIRWSLLSSVSALALIASSPNAVAGGDHPLLWVEFGGAIDAIKGTGDPFDAPFLDTTPTPGPYTVQSPLDVQNPPRFTFGGEGSLTFQPEDSHWVFSAGIRYGRSSNKRDVHYQSVASNYTKNTFYTKYHSKYPSKTTGLGRPYFTQFSSKFAETTVNQSEQHLVLDFQAGKDLGLGMFGRDSTSVISAGVRMARFNSHSDVKIRARPDVDFYGFPFSVSGYAFPGKYLPATRFHTFYLHGSASRSFNGLGPSLSWKGSVPVAGNVQEGQLALDWGINGALLFGRQKARISHHTTDRYFQQYQTHPIAGYSSQITEYTTPYRHSASPDRSRNVTVPNLGANIGLSYRIEDAKLSIGYRADYFFGAMDGGIDAAKKTTLSFNGAYASISIGLGN